MVRRIWPDRLTVQLEEHRAAALWEGAEADRNADRLVNVQGEVFEANVGDVEDERLPSLAGPEGSAARMLSLYQRVQPAFARLELNVDRLHLSGTERFVRTLTQVTARWQQPLEYADLRHAEAYAVRLRGVSTTPPLAGGTAPRVAKTN